MFRWLAGDWQGLSFPEIKAALVLGRKDVQVHVFTHSHGNHTHTKHHGVSMRGPKSEKPSRLNRAGSQYRQEPSFLRIHSCHCQLLDDNSSVQSLSRVWLLATPWTTAHQASLPITNSRSLLKPMSIESVMPSSHLTLCCPFLLLPQSLPASGFFPMSQLFAWGGQSIGFQLQHQSFQWAPRTDLL